MNLHIHSPKGYTFRTIQACGTCKRRRRFIVQMFEWYSTMWTCCGCGNTWSDDGRYKKSKDMLAKCIKQSRVDWRNAMTRRAAMEALSLDIRKHDIGVVNPMADGTGDRHIL